MENVSTRMAAVSHASLESCKRCIDSMGLTVENKIPVQISPKEPSTQVTAKGVAGMDIMAKDIEELVSDFHARIKGARKEHGWSQSDLARRINEKAASIQKVENGIRPTDSVLRKISKALGLKLFDYPSASENRFVVSESTREMTISDSRDSSVAPARKTKTKKRGRKIGVSRSGARTRRQARE